jgi:hypothetical protein
MKEKVPLPACIGCSGVPGRKADTKSTGNTGKGRHSMVPKKIYYENAAATIIKNLKKRRMEGFYCETKEAAVQKALELMPEGASIGWGGSMTLEETGLRKAIEGGRYDLIVREAAKTEEERKAVYARIVNCDYFLMSTNAITMDGELVNIDGRANRISFLCFGPAHVLIVAGMNKVASDLDSAIKRVHDIASPMNTVRLQKKTPCAATGRCGDCLSEDCICAQTLITRLSQDPDRIKVLLVGEELGY